MNLIASFIALSALLSPVPPGSSSGSITGTVGVGSEPLPGVTVTVINKGHGVSRTAVTDAAGNFALGDLPASEGYVLSAELVGFKRFSKKRISLARSPTVSLRIQLKLEPFVGGCCWIVTVPNPPEPGTFVITRAMLDHLPW